MKKVLIFVLLLLISSTAFAANGRKTVTSAGTAEAITSSSLSFKQCSICAETDNTGTIAVGNSGVIASLSTRTGIPLEASECYTIGFGGEDFDYLANYYIDSTVSGDGVTYQCI